MNKNLLATGFVILALAGVTFLGFGAWAFYQIGLTSEASRSDTAEVQKALQLIDQPCDSKDSKGLPLKDGTLCNIYKMTQSFKNLDVTLQKQVSQSQKLVSSASSAIDTLAAHTTPVLDSLRMSSDSVNTLVISGTKTADQLTTSLKAFSDSQTGFPATLSSANLAFNSVTSIVNSKDFKETMGNINSTSLYAAGTVKNVQGITADIKIETGQMVAPKTKTQKFFQYAPGTLKLAAQAGCLLGGVPCP